MEEPLLLPERAAPVSVTELVQLAWEQLTLVPLGTSVKSVLVLVALGFIAQSVRNRYRPGPK